MATLTGDSTEPNVPAVKGSGVNLGVVGTAQDGWAILGESEKQVGVVGRCEDGWGVSGESKTQVGVRGVCDPGWGVTGNSKTGVGVLGVGESGFGVRGDSKTAAGVLGTSESGAGVRASGQTGDGVFATSERGRAVIGVAKTNTGVGGNSTSGTGVFAGSETGFALHAKGGRLAALFEGNVDITGTLNVQGLSFQALVRHIQHLEQQINDLKQRLGSGGTAGTVTQPFVTASVELRTPQGSSGIHNILRVTGNGFQASEQVELSISNLSSTVITANSLGFIAWEIGVNCPGSWRAQARGLSSGRTSNVAPAGCSS